MKVAFIVPPNVELLDLAGTVHRCDSQHGSRFFRHDDVALRYPTRDILDRLVRQPFPEEDLVPAMIGAALMLSGEWTGAGVFNMEQLDPDPFMDRLNRHGLPWQIRELPSPLPF